MIAISKRSAIVALVALAVVGIAAQANAACLGCGTTANYPATYNTHYAGSYSAYYPATYQTYYGGTGWYPGYYWDRIRTRLWGSPTTYVAAYPSTAYYASYAPSYGASYAPTYAASYAAPAAYVSSSTCQTCTAGYAPCSTCSVQQVTMRPVCATACSPPCAAGCSTCAAPVVTQTSYEQPACACAPGAVQVQHDAPSSTRSPDPAVSTFDTNAGSSAAGSGQPEVDPNANIPPERQQQQKPPTNGVPEQPGPGDDTETNQTPEGEFYKKLDSGDGSTMLEPLKLHDPNDRTAQWRSIAPVKTALYKQPVEYRKVSTQRITADQARQDAIGWTSASK